MNSYRICVFAGCLAALWAGGCGTRVKGKYTDQQIAAFPLANRSDLPSATGGMALSLASETITYEEILNALEEMLRPAAARMEWQTFQRGAMSLVREEVRSKAADILLYAEARQQAPANVDDALDKAVQQEINNFVAGFGNNYALAEAELRRMGMDWRTFRDYQKKLIITHSYLSSKLTEKARFTHRQLIEHYERVRDEQFCRTGTLEFHAIDIVPAQLRSDQVGEGQTAHVAALELAAALTARARAGEDFTELARRYSHGPLAASGGKWLPVTVGVNALPSPYNVLEAAALTMEPGEIAGPIVSMDHVFVLRLDRKEMGGCRPFEEVQALIEQQLQFEHQHRQYETYISELIKQANLVEMERFVEFCVQKAYERWKAS